MIKRMYFMFLAFLLMFSSIQAFGNQGVVLVQNEVSKEYEQQFNKAMRLVNADDYKEALSILTALKANSTNNANLDFYIGLCKFYLMFDKNASLEHFKVASKSISEKYQNTPEQLQAPVESIYFEALSYHYLGQYAEAKKLYESYLEKSKTAKTDKKYVKSAKQKIKYCNNPDLVFSNTDYEEIKKNRQDAKPKKQDFAYKNKLSSALEVMEYDHIEALVMFKEMAKEYPNDPNINYFMGISMLNHKPHQQKALEMFEVADKLIVSPSSQTGLACPTMNRYYMAVANQMEGNHEKALKLFEEVEKVYPEKFTAFKTDFNEKMELSRNMTKVEVVETAELKSVRDRLDIKIAKDLHVEFPVVKPRVSLNKSTTADRIEYSNSGYYFTVQIAEGFMREDYFKNAPDYRISRPKGSKFPRYVVGKYETEADAIKKMDELKSAGYKDAFVIRYKSRLN
jgi:tetratricopeptide (TPR) repeat protein